MIRQATEADVPRIVEMGERSLREGPYRDQIGNANRAAGLALGVIANKGGCILLYEENGRAEGLLAFIVFPHYFSGEITAGEVMWYVEPEARKSKSFTDTPALNLLRAAEQRAREMGAKRMQFTAPTRSVGKLYERIGYRQIEVSYQRTL